jgi:uncharacterized metal-binding protein YceD (DUF177 family)
MKIRISDIPSIGLNINETIPLRPLNERLSQGSDKSIQFLEDPRVQLLLERNTTGATASGSVSSRYIQPCSRCAQELPRDIELRLDFVLSERPGHPTHGREATPEEELIDDIGIIYYENDQVDLEDFIQESLILALSLYWHPPEDKKGNCEVCGKHFGDAPKKKEGLASLGEILKKAGI